MNSKLPINIAVIGNKSVGKTTLINAFTIKKYESISNQSQPVIYQEILHATEENSEFSEIYKQINRTNELHIHKGAYVTYTYIPAIDNQNSHEYINKNFHNYNIIVYMMDITEHTDNNFSNLEELMNKISVNNTSTKRTYLLICVNKCDEMDFDENELTIENDQHSKLYSKMEETIMSMANNKNMSDICSIYPISCEMAYFYRLCKNYKATGLDKKHIDKLGIREYGKQWKIMVKNRISAEKKLMADIATRDIYKSNMDNTGFTILLDSLNSIFEKCQYDMLYGNLIDEFEQLQSLEKMDATKDTSRVIAGMDTYKEMSKKASYIDNMFGVKNGGSYFTANIVKDLTMLGFNISDLVKNEVKTEEDYSAAYNTNEIINKIIKYQMNYVIDNELFTSFLEQQTKIKESINQYAYKLAESGEKMSTELFYRHVDILHQNKYDNINVYIQGNVNRVQDSNEKIIKLFEKISSEIIKNTGDMIAITHMFIEHKIREIYKNKTTIGTSKNNIKYITMLNTYLNNITNKTDEAYNICKKILMLTNALYHYYLSSSDNDVFNIIDSMDILECENMIIVEKYLNELIILDKNKISTDKNTNNIDSNSISNANNIEDEDEDEDEAEDDEDEDVESESSEDIKPVKKVLQPIAKK